VALATRRGPNGGRSRLRLLLRALLIGALGLHLGGLDVDVAVILAYYAVFFVLLLPFLGWPPAAPARSRPRRSPCSRRC
jgi:hypothetical protein